MTWYYADAGRQVGPLEEAALDDLVRSGVVRDDTLVWRDGMPTWQPHGAVRGVRPPPPPPMPVAMPTGAPTAYCSECGRPFPQDQLVTLGHAAVCAQCKPLYLQRVRESGQPATIGARRYGGFWIRFVARLIDTVILGVVFLIINLPLQAILGVGAVSGGGGFLNLAGLAGMFGISMLLNLALAFAYEAYFVGTRGGTPGKLVLGLRVINADGSPLTISQAAIRYAAMMINSFTFMIGYIIAAFDVEKRGLHDRICNTRVIHVN